MTMIEETVQRKAALPGALVMVAGLFLVVWALRGWGVLGGMVTDG